MKIKSIVAMLAMLAVSVSSVSAIPASAAPEQDSIVDMPVSPQYSHAAAVGSTLSITSSGKAYCISDGSGKSQVKSLNCMQYLEKKNLLGKWNPVTNWFKSSSGSAIYMSNTKSDLSSGTYRLRSVFTFYAVGGYEEVTAYSYECKY